MSHPPPPHPPSSPRPHLTPFTKRKVTTLCGWHAHLLIYVHLYVYTCICDLWWALLMFNLVFIFITVLHAYSLENQLFLQAYYEKLKSSPMPTPPFPSFQKQSICHLLADSLGIYLHITKYISYITAS